MKKLTILLAALAIIFFLSSCGNENASYEDVSVDETKQLMDNNEVVVLDVRTEEEFQSGHIPTAHLIPLHELEGRINELDKDESYLVVCRSGNRSTQASELLIENGFTNIYNMTGGMNDWVYEVE